MCVGVCMCVARGFPCFWELRACWDSGAVCRWPLHLEPAWSLHCLAVLSVGVCVCFSNAETLQAVTVPETLTNQLFSFTFPLSFYAPFSWVRSQMRHYLSGYTVLQSAEATMYCCSYFHPPSCTVFLSLTGTATHILSGCVCVCVHALPSPQLSDADYRLCVVLSVHVQDCSSRCAQRLCVLACVCVLRVHVLRLVLFGVAYGCRAGWALLCTPGVKWTV